MSLAQAPNDLHRIPQWNDGRIYTQSLGCRGCPDRDLCGGLSVRLSLYNCLDYCCEDPDACDIVCRNNPQVFVRSIREVGGFELDNIPRAPKRLSASIPSLVPILYSGTSRERPFYTSAVCIPLYKVMPRHGRYTRFEDASTVAERFRFVSGTPLLLTGVAKDRDVEAWWHLGSRRLDIIRKFREWGVRLVTTPNFSLFSDRPRWDDLHSIKRIATTHEEFLQVGVPAALHLNARTERDWQTWTKYVKSRDEVTHVAFEFGTGAGRVDRLGVSPK